jgi:regulatory protein
MKITGIEAQVKTKGRYSVFVDEKFAFGISEQGLINSGIRIGTEITKDELEKLSEDAHTDKLYNMALGLIARRPRSEWELQDYLKRKKLDQPTRDKIIKRLRELGYVNDQDFAQRWVENRRLLKPISKRKLILELKQKRIRDDVIQGVMHSDETEDIQAIKQEITKKRRQTRYSDDTKLMQYLARQGYGYQDIRRALNEEKKDS